MTTWQSTPIHVIDFEGSRQSGIVEYGVVTLLEGNILSTHTRLCGAKGKIDPREVKEHGIRMEDLEGHEPVDADLDQFCDWRKTGVFAAHNGIVEDTLIRDVWPYPCAVPDFIHSNAVQYTWGPWYDTYVLYKRIFKKLESYRLQDLVNRFQLTTELETLAQEHCPEPRRKYHCALYDALGTALLLKHLGTLPGYDVLPVSWMMAESCRNPQKRQELQQENFFPSLQVD